MLSKSPRLPYYNVAGLPSLEGMGGTGLDPRCYRSGGWGFGLDPRYRDPTVAHSAFHVGHPMTSAEKIRLNYPDGWGEMGWESESNREVALQQT